MNWLLTFLGFGAIIYVMKIKIGSEVSDGFEDGVVVDIEMDGGDKWICVWDGKEAWKMHERDVVKVNEKFVKDSIEGDV